MNWHSVLTVIAAVEQESLTATGQHAGGCKQKYKECRSAVSDLLLIELSESANSHIKRILRHLRSRHHTHEEAAWLVCQQANLNLTRLVSSAASLKKLLLAVKKPAPVAAPLDFQKHAPDAALKVVVPPVNFSLIDHQRHRNTVPCDRAKASRLRLLMLLLASAALKV
jgi:hypothetical protein